MYKLLSVVYLLPSLARGIEGGCGVGVRMEGREGRRERDGIRWNGELRRSGCGMFCPLTLEGPASGEKKREEK